MHPLNPTPSGQRRDWLAALLLHQPDGFAPRLVAAVGRWRALPRGVRRRWQRRVAVTTAGAALALALAAGPLLPTAYAATLTVAAGEVVALENDICSLREAIINANDDAATFDDCLAGNGADVIELPPGADFLLEDGPYYGNQPLGLPVVADNLTIEGHGATIRRDTSDTDEFGILMVTYNELTVNDTTISGGKANVGGGILGFFSTIILDGSTVSDNYALGGGAVAAIYGEMTVANSAIINNTAEIGGGVMGGFFTVPVDTQITIVNSTISGNLAAIGGGVVAGFAGPTYTSLTIVHSTITANTAIDAAGGVLVRSDEGYVDLSHSIVSGNVAPTAAEIAVVDNDPGDLVVSTDHNVFGHDGLFAVDAFFNFFTPGPTDVDATNNSLTPYALEDILDVTLSGNGGPTFTHALPAGSPAIDLAPDGPATDQRGEPRPAGAAFDAGAFELQQGYTFTGFFSPVDNPPTINQVKAGSAIPVKFSLGGDFGLEIFADGYPLSQPAVCDAGASTDPIEETVSAGGSGLQYDPLTDTYTYVWKTNKTWRGCREIVLMLDDGSTYTAMFKFR